MSAPARLLRPALWLPALAWSAALALTAWALATVFWMFATPAAIAALPRTETDPRAAARAIARVLGEAPAPAASAAPAAGDDRLIGLATGFGALPGFALLQGEAGDTVTLVAGERLPDGRRLAHIRADHIEFDDGSRLLLRPSAPAAAPPRAAARSD